jgi:hypothetical protein
MTQKSQRGFSLFTPTSNLVKSDLDLDIPALPPECMEKLGYQK